jgi:hypothetical protein
MNIPHGNGAGQQLPLKQLPRIPPERGFSFLEGVKIVDLSSSIAGLFAAMLLGDWGG